MQLGPRNSVSLRVKKGFCILGLDPRYEKSIPGA